MWHLCFSLQVGLKENDYWLLSFLSGLEEHSQGLVGRALIPSVPQLSLDIAAPQGQSKLQRGSVITGGPPCAHRSLESAGCRAAGLCSLFSRECSQTPKQQVWLSLPYIIKRANWHQSTVS